MNGSREELFKRAEKHKNGSEEEQQQVHLFLKSYDGSDYKKLCFITNDNIQHIIDKYNFDFMQGSAHLRQEIC